MRDASFRAHRWGETAIVVWQQRQAEDGRITTGYVFRTSLVSHALSQRDFGAPFNPAIHFFGSSDVIGLDSAGFLDTTKLCVLIEGSHN